MRTAALALLVAAAVPPAACAVAERREGNFDQGVDASQALAEAREEAARTPAPPGIAAPEAAAARRSVFVLKTAGVCDGCAEAVSKMLFTAGIRSQILGAEQLKAAVGPRDLIVIGGGDPDGEGEWTVKQALVKAGAFDWLKAHIAGGGRYVGICAGAYLTEEWIDRDAGEKGLDIFPGRIDNYMKDRSAHYILTRWGRASTKRWVYFQDGPGMWPRPGADIDVLGVFDKDGSAAAAVFSYGKGKVGVVSPHPEADEEWARVGGIVDKDGIDYDLGIELIRRTLE